MNEVFPDFSKALDYVGLVNTSLQSCVTIGGIPLDRQTGVVVPIFKEGE